MEGTPHDLINDHNKNSTVRSLAFSTEKNCSMSSFLAPEQVLDVLPVNDGNDRDQEDDHNQVLLCKDSGREKLMKHQEEIAGRVSIPDTWGQEDLLKDWIDCSTFDELLAPNGISSAREALVAEGRRESSQRLRIASRC